MVVVWGLLRPDNVARPFLLLIKGRVKLAPLDQAEMPAHLSPSVHKDLKIFESTFISQLRNIQISTFS